LTVDSAVKNRSQKRPETGVLPMARRISDTKRSASGADCCQIAKKHLRRGKNRTNIGLAIISPTIAQLSQQFF
jgi:hypothetical protein